MDIQDIDIILVTERTLHTNELQQIIEQAGINVCATVQKLHNLSSVVEKYNPNLLLLDVTYIRKDRTIIDEIVVKYQIPLIILSSRSVHDTAKTVYAITKGASDFILCDQLNKPYYKKEIIHKINSVIHSKRPNKKPHNRQQKQVIKKVEKKKKQPKRRHQQKKKVAYRKRSGQAIDSIVAVGTSTGGPKALQTVLSKIPKDFPAPIVIVQHMPSGFTKSLAKRLNNLCHIAVEEAVDGQPLKPGTAYIAPGNYHMAVNESLDLCIYHDRERDGHRPSVNILFESIARLDEVNKVAVILTGMGKDGAAGVREIKKYDQEAIIIVESIETAIIHGMPRATLETGYVSEITRLENIGDQIINYIMKRGN